MLHLRELLEGAAPECPTVVTSGVEAFSAIAHDSRNVMGGELFVAIRTAHGDGHTFIREAHARGAAGFLVERELEGLAPWADLGSTAPVPTVVRVRDTRAALRAWAGFRLRGSRVVAISGSLGKSTAQDALRRVWEAASGVPVQSGGDRNDALGIPVAVGSFPVGPAQVVVEVVAGDGTERRQLAEMLRPKALVFTGAQDAEQLYWTSQEDLAAGINALADGASPLVMPVADVTHFPQFSGRPRYTFGALGSGADVEVGPDPAAQGARWPYPWGCLIMVEGRRWSVRTQLHPELAAVGWGAAVACLLALGLNPGDGVSALADAQPLPGRLRTWPGLPGGLVVDDTVDATTSSVQLALSALATLPPPRLAVIGPATRPIWSDDARALAEKAVIDIIVPEDAGSKGQGLPVGVGTGPLGSVEEMALQALAAGGTVLVKGAASERLERLCARLVRPGAILVRQDRGRRLMSFRSPRRPTWVEMDLGALVANVADLVADLEGTALMAVVKADAYGHGAVQVARTALSAGARWVATATLAEAAALRSAGIEAPCLVLGYTPPDQVEEAHRLGLVLTVFDHEVLAALESAGDRSRRPAKAHLKVDTGMTRLGIAPGEIVAFVTAADRLPHVDLEGAYTHFRKGQDPAVVALQLERFLSSLAAAERAGHRFRVRHAANSAAWAHMPDSRLDLVRCGGEMLGLRTGDGRRRRPVLSLKTTVAQLRRIEAGTNVGYGDTFRSSRCLTVATLPVGYGDGFRRGPSNFGVVLIRGRRHPVIGDVSMDMTMVDVSTDPAVSRGDQVVLIGRQGGDEISAEDVAERLGTISYEVVTQILPRVPREAVLGETWTG